MIIHCFCHSLLAWQPIFRFWPLLRIPKVHTILVAKGYVNEAMQVVHWYTWLLDIQPWKWYTTKLVLMPKFPKQRMSALGSPGSNSLAQGFQEESWELARKMHEHRLDLSLCLSEWKMLRQLNRPNKVSPAILELHHRIFCTTSISMKTAGLFNFKWSFIAVPFLFKYNKTRFEMFLQMPKLVFPVHVS